jgi:hypothetical protein
MRRASSVLGVALVVTLSACSHHLWSPPARVLPLEGVGALAAAEVRVQGIGHHHLPVDGLDQRPDPVGGGTELAVGLGGGVDLRLTGQALHLAGGGPTSLDREVVAGRAGVRWSRRWMALSAGVGAGAHAAGAFVAPDVGLTLGDGGERVGFFFDLRLGASVPVDPKTVDLTRPGDGDRRLATPAPTAVVQATSGVRVTVPLPEGTGVGLVWRVAPGMAWLIDEEESSWWVGAGTALELSFGGPPREARDDPPVGLTPVR